MDYPIRINKYLSEKGLASRREADRLIEARKVFINGKVAQLGQQINEADTVEVKGFKKEYVYYAFNKPVGVVTHSPQKGEQEIADIIQAPEKMYPLGRLDKESHGLIILTNDGRITEKILGPEAEVEKEYHVQVDRPLNNLIKKYLQSGVELEDGYVTKPARFKEIDETIFTLTITEGKKHQIRRMCAVFGYVVRDLERIRIGNIQLKNLKSGQLRKIEGVELEEFLKSLGVN